MKSRVWFVLLLLFVPAAFARDWYFIAKANQVRPGLTAAQVTALLGEPDSMSPKEVPATSEAVWHYRFLSLAQRNNDMLDDMGLLASGRMRLWFRDGVVAHVSGLWPTPTRPSAGTPKNKIMLVDPSAVYDRLKATAAFNQEITGLNAKAEAEVQEMNKAGNALYFEMQRVEKELKGFKGASAERKTREDAVRQMKEQITAKQKEIEAFIAKTRASLNERLARFIDLRLPSLADAILKFQHERGYEFVYQTKPVFSPDTKPALVSGTDETDAILKWIDNGNAKELGI